MHGGRNRRGANAGPAPGVPIDHCAPIPPVRGYDDAGLDTALGRIPNRWGFSPRKVAGQIAVERVLVGYGVRAQYRQRVELQHEQRQPEQHEQEQ